MGADKVGFKDDLYVLPHGIPEWLTHIDFWGYEGKLPRALNLLRNKGGTIPTISWLGNLVPFATGLFVRGPDSNQGVNTEGRIIEFQELLAPFMCARWSVLHFPSSCRLITSDRAYSFVEEPPGPGLVIPTDPNTALLLSYNGTRDVTTHKDGGWETEIDHIDCATDLARLVNVSTATHARSSIFGSTAHAVDDLSSYIGTVDGTRIPAPVVSPRDCDLDCHIYDYYRALSAINSPQELAVENAAKIDFQYIGRDWDTPIAVQGLFGERTRGGLEVRSDYIGLDLSWGKAIAQARREVGDFRRGAYAVFPYMKVHNFDPPLGLQWQNGLHEYVTTFQNFENGVQATMDLAHLRSDLGLS